MAKKIKSLKNIQGFDTSVGKILPFGNLKNILKNTNDSMYENIVTDNQTSWNIDINKLENEIRDWVIEDIIIETIPFPESRQEELLNSARGWFNQWFIDTFKNSRQFRSSNAQGFFQDFYNTLADSLYDSPKPLSTITSESLKKMFFDIFNGMRKKFVKQQEEISSLDTVSLN